MKTNLGKAFVHNLAEVASVDIGDGTRIWQFAVVLAERRSVRNATSVRIVPDREELANSKAKLRRLEWPEFMLVVQGAHLRTISLDHSGIRIEGTT
jgi:hypothetical protein